jgi:hypothetical protein
MVKRKGTKQSRPTKEPTEEPTKIDRRTTRISTIDYLRETKQGRDKLGEMLLAIQSGCYAHVAASMIGITPSTFSKWLKRGREEDQGKYRELWEDVVEAISIARCQAEIKVAQTNPLHYLTRGAGRILGDNYSDALTKQVYDHNVDGSVALPGQGHLTVRDNEEDNQGALPSPTDHVGKADLVAALIELRKAGVDLNAMVEQQEKLMGVRPMLEADGNGESTSG